MQLHDTSLPVEVDRPKISKTIGTILSHILAPALASHISSLPPVPRQQTFFLQCSEIWTILFYVNKPPNTPAFRRICDKQSFFPRCQKKPPFHIALYSRCEKYKIKTFSPIQHQPPNFYLGNSCEPDRDRQKTDRQTTDDRRLTQIKEEYTCVTILYATTLIGFVHPWMLLGWM